MPKGVGYSPSGKKTKPQPRRRRNPAGRKLKSVPKTKRGR